MSARILVLGGDGMLGRMVRLYLGADSEFVVDWTSRHEEPGAIRFDADSPHGLLDAAEHRAGYDYLVNCIAVLKNRAQEEDGTAAAECMRVNAVFPHELAAIAAQIGARLIHISTDAVFPPGSGVCRESDLPSPVDVYGRSKFLGEVTAPHALSIRCSVIGPNPIKKRGLLEWILEQPRNAKIPGYYDQLWCGATTLQFGQLCAALFRDENFSRARAEKAVHHFCPNATVTKSELIELLCDEFRPDLVVERVSGGASNRVLACTGALRQIWGEERPMAVAIGELSTYMHGPKAGQE